MSRTGQGCFPRPREEGFCPKDRSDREALVQATAYPGRPLITLIDRIVRTADAGLHEGMAVKAADVPGAMADRDEPAWKQLVVQAVFRRLMFEIHEGEVEADAEAGDEPIVVKLFNFTRVKLAFCFYPGKMSS